MFPHGLSTSSLASGDPFAQYRLRRGSLPHTTSTPIPSKSDHDSTPPPPTFFTYRPPITFMKRTASQRKCLQRKLLFAHRHRIPQSPSKSRCARFRIWFNEARTHRRQLKMIAEIRTQFAGGVTNDAERAAISLSLFISLSSVFISLSSVLYKISCLPPTPRPLKCPRSSNSDTVHINTNLNPLNPSVPPFVPASLLGRKRPRSP